MVRKCGVIQSPNGGERGTETGTGKKRKKGEWSGRCTNATANYLLIIVTATIVTSTSSISSWDIVLSCAIMFLELTEMWLGLRKESSPTHCMNELQPVVSGVLLQVAAADSEWATAKHLFNCAWQLRFCMAAGSLLILGLPVSLTVRVQQPFNNLLAGSGHAVLQPNKSKDRLQTACIIIVVSPIETSYQTL